MIVKSICKICGQKFTYEKPTHARKIRTICDNPETKCHQKNRSQYYKKWAINNPGKIKEKQHQHYERRKANKQGYQYIGRDKPQAKIKRKCVYPGCKQLTAQGGVNYFYCQQHWDIMQEGCSSEHPNLVYIYNNEKLSERSPFCGIGKVRK